MDAGGLAQTTAGSGLASRRAAQKSITPLSLGSASNIDAGAPTPRTSRSHLLAGLRTAPRTSTATNFPTSSTAAATSQAFGWPNGQSAHDNLYDAPRTAHPFVGGGGGGSHMAGYISPHVGVQQQYTTDQVLQPPEIRVQDGQDDAHYAQMMGANNFLAQQSQQLQQYMANLTAMQQHLGLLGTLTPQQQQQYLMCAQLQQQTLQMQESLAAAQSPNLFAYFDPSTGQQYLLTQPQAALLGIGYAADPSSMGQGQGSVSMGQSYMAAQGAANAPPVVQVSAPAEQQQQQRQQRLHQTQQGQGQHGGGFRAGTPPKRFGSPGTDAAPLPPPSANAFRRGHKKSPSLANINSSLSMTVSHDAPRSAGPRTSSFPQAPLTGHGPGQNRGGEHPIRQPRIPPPMEELLEKPTAKHEGSKNFAARTRRSAVSSLVRAGLGRRNGTPSSSLGSGATSPTSEFAEEVESPVTEDSGSVRSGSSSLAGDIECSLPSSRSSSGTTWGVIGSDRPSSRQKSHQSVEGVDGVDCVDTIDSTFGALTASGGESNTTFATVFKNAQRASKEAGSEGQRKGARLILTKSNSGLSSA